MRLIRFAAFALIVAGAVGVWLSTRAMPREGLASRVGFFPEASVVVVTLDTTRADRLGCYGSQAGLTPFMDSLAELGILFEQAQAATPITLPSHVSIFTGLLPTHHGVRNNGMFSVPPDIETMAETYSEAGYATGAFVSAQVLVSRYGLDRGFDVYDDDLSQSRKSGQGMVPSRRGDLTLNRALEWLQGTDEDQPVFMWLHLYDPHAPYSPPPEFRRRFPTDPYGGEIAFTDAIVRMLTDNLKASGRFENTILTVLADHGESLGEHGEGTHGILLHQPTIHVPWILVTPDHSRRIRIKQPVSTVDVSAVLGALTGVTPPNTLRQDGQSDFFDEKLTNDREIYFEAALPLFQYGWSALRGLRKGQWEIIKGHREELFDLTNDPRELTDLAMTKPLELSFLGERVAEIASRDSGLDPGATQEIKPSERAALEALGYVGTTASIRRDPPDPRDLVGGHVHAESSRVLMAAGRLDEALHEIDLMLADDPENLAALNLKSQLFMQLRQFDDAEAVLKKSLELDPQNSDVVAGLAKIEWSQGRFDRVIELARIGRTTRSPFGTFDALEAKALIALDRREEAADLLESTLAQNPEDADLLVARATMSMQDQRLEEAETDLRLAVMADPFHSLARRNLGQLLERDGRVDEAIGVFEDMLQINPSDATALLSVGTMKLQSSPSEAIPFLEEAVRLAPGKEANMATLGAAYLQAGQLSEAEATLRRTLTIAPTNSAARHNLSIVLIHQGKYNQAVKNLRSLVAKHPRFFQARNSLAVALGARGDLASAETEIRKALQQQPDYIDGQMTLASILHRQGAFDEEYQVLEAVKTAAPHTLDVGARMGLAAAYGGNCPVALKAFSSIEEDLPWEAGIAAAQCYEKMDQFQEARRHYELALEMELPSEIRIDAENALRQIP